MANYYFNNTSTSNTDWNDSNNWWDSPGASGGNVSVPSPGNTGDELYFETNCDTNIPTDFSYNVIIQTGVTFTISGVTTTLQPGDYFTTVNGTLNVYSDFDGSNVSVNNICNINAVVNFAPGTGTLSSGSTINVLGGTLFLYNYNTNFSTINVTGTIVYMFCTIVSAPSPVSNATISIAGDSNISANITINSGVNLTITSSTISTGYVVTNNSAASINGVSGFGSFVNNNICTITSNGLSNTTFTNNGTCTVSSGGIFKPTIFNNNGTININGDLSMNSSSVYTNNGTFNFGSLYSTKFKGRIFPQVPSSASWGNALL